MKQFTIKYLLILFFYFLSVQVAFSQDKNDILSQFSPLFYRASLSLEKLDISSKKSPILQNNINVFDTISQNSVLREQLSLDSIKNIKKDKLSYFISHEIALQKQNSPKRKKWQVAMFLAAETRPTEETLAILRRQITAGGLAQAVVISFEEGEEREGNFYLIYDSEKGPVTEHKKVPVKTDEGTLFSMLFSHFNRYRSDYYTGLVVDAHGSGSCMFYAKEGEFTLWKMLEEIKKLPLSIDVLDIQSCHMGSVYNIYKLAEYDSVLYAILSSDINVGFSEINYYHLLETLHLPPYQAALNAFKLSEKKMKEIYQTASVYSKNHTAQGEAHNAILLSIKELKDGILSYLKAYGNIQNEEGMQENLQKIFRHEDDWRSFLRVVNMQASFVQKNKDLSDDRFIHFLEKSEEMKKSLYRSLLGQWCYSAKHDTLYVNNIPNNNNGCINGISAIKYQIEWMLEDFPPKSTPFRIYI